jgi:hypothetical protein
MFVPKDILNRKRGRALVDFFGSRELASRYIKFIRNCFRNHDIIFKTFGIKFSPAEPAEYYKERRKRKDGSVKIVYRYIDDPKQPMFSPIKSTEHTKHKVGPDEFREIAAIAFYVANVESPIANQVIEVLEPDSITRATIYKWFRKLKALKLKQQANKRKRKTTPQNGAIILIKELFKVRKPREVGANDLPDGWRKP